MLTKNYVWRKKDEQLHSDCVGAHVIPNKDRNVKFSAMFWGCITYLGVGTLTPVDGNITCNSEKYFLILDEKLWPFVARHFANNRWTLQEDNAACHVSWQTTTWKTNNGILTLFRPSQILRLLKMSGKLLKITLQSEFWKFKLNKICN